MKKVLFYCMASMLLSSGLVLADDNAPAILETTEGKAFKVYLMDIQNDVVSTEYQKLRQKKQYPKAEIKLLKFTHEEFDAGAITEAYALANYAEVIQTLEPVVAPYERYMSVSNNLQDTFCVLMKAYSRSGNNERAGSLSANLLGTDDSELKLNALVCAALSSARLGDVATAEKLLEQIKDPAAAMYVQTAIVQVKGEPREAIQVAVDMIAKHANDMEWLPPTEIICSELYLELGRTNSAFVTARQTQKIYAGMNFGKEAEALRSKLELSLVDSE